MSPQQAARMPPAFADDVYALGCTMILLLTGLDPRRVFFASEKHRVRQLLELSNGAPPELIEVVAACVNNTPTARPHLQSVKTTIQHCIASLVDRKTSSRSATLGFEKGQNGSPNLDQLNKYISGGQQGLLRDVISDQASGLWLSPALESISNQGVSTSQGSYELRRSANRGVAGVVYMLGRLARFGHGMNPVYDKAQRSIEWLLKNEPTPDDQMPGLHFGEAGVAVAISEAISGGLMNQTDQLDAYLRAALSGPLDWPDITHGAAGQGIAVFSCADRLRDPTLLVLAHRCANYLIAHQKEDGSWEMPPGVEGMSGQTLTGFAHGVSGIVYFLAEYARRFGDSSARKAWQAGAAWLVEQAIPTDDGQALEWVYSNTQNDRWKWWCHGSPGIALTFLKLYEQTGDLLYAESATKALKVHPLNIRCPNLSQCHGLSGLGEIYLEAGRVLADQQWYDRAKVIAKILIDLCHKTEKGSVTWSVENPHMATADLMVGSSGVLHFLLRLKLDGEEMSFPLLLDPIETQGRPC